MPSFLYVEDDMLSREVMDVILREVLGYTEVTIFEDSRDFTQRVEQLPHIPDVIFLDIHMQPDDGFHLLAMLRENPYYENSRIIAVTASVMNTEINILQKAGFDGVIPKPINQRTFGDVVTRILNGETIWSIK